MAVIFGSPRNKAYGRTFDQFCQHHGFVQIAFPAVVDYGQLPPQVSIFAGGGVEIKQPQGSLDKAVIQLLAFFIAHFVKLEQSFEGLGCHIWLPSIVIVYSQPRLSYILHCKAGQIVSPSLLVASGPY